MNIRYAKTSDIDFLIQGLEDARFLAGWDKETVSNPKDRSDFEKAIEKKLVRVAEVDGEPAAFLQFKDDFKVMYVNGDFFWVNVIYVKDGYRGQGLGKALYADIEEIAKTRNVKKIVLDIFGINEESVTFHKKVGFEPLYTIYQKEV